MAWQHYLGYIYYFPEDYLKTNCFVKFHCSWLSLGWHLMTILCSLEPVATNNFETDKAVTIPLRIEYVHVVYGALCDCHVRLCVKQQSRRGSVKAVYKAMKLFVFPHMTFDMGG